jgi:NADH-quinone oxidoreductase subunit J
MEMIDLVLLIAMTLAALWTVMSRSLLKATIGLAVTSAVISILMFRLASPLAAVFELSVCAGLITVVFVSTISLTKPLTHKEIETISRNRIRRYIYLLPIVMVAAIILSSLKLTCRMMPVMAPAAVRDVREVLWSLRQFDMFGQVIMIILGALGVVILFRESKRDGS